MPQTSGFRHQVTLRNKYATLILSQTSSVFSWKEDGDWGEDRKWEHLPGTYECIHDFQRVETSYTNTHTHSLG